MMAPEVFKGEDYTFTADYYSLGVLAWELVTGSPPFMRTKSQREILTKVVHEQPKIPNDLSWELQDFLKRLLAKDPSYRLGYNGYKEIMNHPWLAGIDFEKVKARTYPSSIDLSDALPSLKFNKVYHLKCENEFNTDAENIPNESYLFCYETSQATVLPTATKKQFKLKPDFARFSESTKSNMIPLSKENVIGLSFDSSNNSIMNMYFKEASLSFTRNSDHGRFQSFISYKFPKNRLRYDQGRVDDEIPVEETPMTVMIPAYQTLKPKILADR